MGGPVDIGKIFILALSKTRLPESQLLSGDLQITSSVDTLLRIHTIPDGDEKVRVFFGYAGWGAGQLLKEIEKGDWRVMDGDPALVFDENPAGLWKQLIKKKAGETPSAL